METCVNLLIHRLANTFSVFFLHADTQIIPVKRAEEIQEVPCQCGNHCNWTESDFRLEIEAPRRTMNSIPGWIIAEDHNRKIHRNLSAIIEIFKVSPILWPFTKLLRRYQKFFKVL